MVESVASTFCIDEASIHQSGISNGGMFAYFMASKLRSSYILNMKIVDTRLKKSLTCSETNAKIFCELFVRVDPLNTST